MKLARKDDVSTSHEAAEAIQNDETHRLQMDLVRKALCLYPGMTSAELASRSGIERHTVARRLPDLMKKGKAVRGNKITCWATGYTSFTWWPVGGA